MKRISIALMTLAATLAAVSCQKVFEPKEQPSGQMTITAVAEQFTTPDLTKAEMAYRYDILWQEKDSICVKDASNTAIFKLVKGAGTTKGTFTGSTVTGDVKAYYPASLVNGEKLIWPAVQQNNQVAPMFCKKNITTDTEEFNFKSLGAVMQIVLTTPLKGITLKSISIEDGEKTMSGEFTVENDSLAVITATDKAGITLDLGAGEAIGETAKYFNIAVPAGKYNDLTLTFTATDGSKCVMKSTTLPEIKRNVVGKLTLSAPQFKGNAPAGALKGEFTVSAEGKKVHFSQGNLYYDGSNWGFEEEQYYFRTYDGYGKCDKNGYSSSAGTASGHWGLFGWSTSATTYGMSTSIDENDYLGDFIDWGTAIDSKGTWTTLSGGEDGEWRYLFDHHVNVWGTCNNVPGRFIAPDGFVGDESALSEAIKDWGSAQAAGIVFLPAAGSRDGSSMLLSVGEVGWYWSSSPCEIPGTAFYVSFSDWNVAPVPSTFRYEGMSVRLVTESCAPDHLPFVAVESVSLDKTELSLEVGATETLTATILPDNATNKELIWTSSDPAVATVDAEGKVTAVAEGTATITAISDATHTATCTVTVSPKRTFKAVYNTTDDANTLTFYYDNVDHSGTNITVYENGTANYLFDDTKSKQAKWGYSSIMFSAKSVDIDKSVAAYTGLTSTTYMFYWMLYSETISGLQYLDVSRVTDMSYMFYRYGQGSLTLDAVPDVSGWDTGNVKNMSHMFDGYGYGSKSLNTVPNVGGWNTGNVTDMQYMFYAYGTSSTVLDTVPNVSGWNTGNVTDMNHMFNEYGASSTVLNTVPNVSSWNTGNVTDMQAMFSNYGSSSTVLNAVPNVSSWNTGNVTDMNHMFSNYGNSSTVLNAVPDVSGWNTGNVTNMQYMFYAYGNLSTVLNTVPNVSGWNTGNVTDMNHMFYTYGSYSNNINCELDLSGWSLAKLKDGNALFDFSPKTFNVKIPAKTGEKSNTTSKWYYNNGTSTVSPPSERSFTVAEVPATGSTIEDFNKKGDGSSNWE